MNTFREVQAAIISTPVIVQPNFLDHWKTRLLQSELGDDPLAPTYILRIWGHCQEQKTHRFPKLSAPALAAICCFKTSPEQLWLAMQTAGFIEVKNTTVEVHEWDKYNSGLITSWSNGKKGGRPKKPTGIPRATHGKPGDNPGVTDREDGIEKMDNAAQPAKPARARDELFDALAESCGRDPKQMTKPDCQACAVALAQIKGVASDLTADEIRRRAARYAKVMPQGSRVTPHALAKNWAICGDYRAPSLPLTVPLEGPKGWRDTLRAIYPDHAFEGNWSTLPASRQAEVIAGRRLTA